MATSKPIRMVVIYRVKKGREAEFLPLLERHWPALYGMGLATPEPAQVFRAQDKAAHSAFIEQFSWKDMKAPEVAHQTPEVMAIWEPMGEFLDGLELWMVEPVAMPFAKS